MIAHEREALSGRVSEETEGVRKMMAGLLALARGTQEAWGVLSTLGAEDEYLRVRTGGPPRLETTRPDRVTREELTRFLQELERALTQEPATGRWLSMASEYQEAERRKAAHALRAAEQLTPAEELARQHQLHNESLNRVAESRRLAEEASVRAQNKKVDQRATPLPPYPTITRSY